MIRKKNKQTKQVYQKELGQFYTNQNIFMFDAFVEWHNNIPEEKKHITLEPFAGKNGLIDMLSKANLLKDFISYDIHPKSPDVKKRDTIKRFPKGYSLSVSNPPFLAKNVATRNGLNAQLCEMENFSDVYLRCLSISLENCEYVAMILPESFIVSELFKERLFCVISINIKNLFKDTEQPVCLALFNPESQEDFKVYQCNDFLGYFRKIKENINQWLLEGVPKHDYNKNVYRHDGVKFHVTEGQFGINCIDATNQYKKITFINGNLIEDKDVGYHARLRARFLVKSPNEELFNEEEFILKLNHVLNEYRYLTNDMFLTAFKGLRDDNKYRRRIDFTTVRMIVNKVYFNIFKINN